MELMQAYRDIQIQKYGQRQQQASRRIFNTISGPAQTVSTHSVREGKLWSSKERDMIVQGEEIPWYQRRVRELSESMINEYARQF